MQPSPAAWNAHAASFDLEPDHGLLDADVRAAWSALLASVLPSPPMRVADLGCGTGSLSVLLAEAGHRVHGIDFAADMLAIARAKAANASVDVAFAEAHAAAPPLPAGCWDVVLARHVLWALADPVDALGRWVELLAPGGILVLIEGRWSTGAGITASDARRLVLAVRQEAEVRRLDDDAWLWGGPVDDERYLLLSRR